MCCPGCGCCLLSLSTERTTQGEVYEVVGIAQDGKYVFIQEEQRAFSCASRLVLSTRTWP